MLVGFDNGNIGFHGLAVLKSGFGFFFGGFVFFKHHFGEFYYFLITYALTRLELKDAVVESVVGNALSSTGFVTFKDRFSATSASQSRIEVKRKQMFWNYKVYRFYFFPFGNCSWCW